MPMHVEDADRLQERDLERLAQCFRSNERADGVRCERCWRYVDKVSSDPATAGLCERCQDALADT